MPKGTEMDPFDRMVTSLKALGHPVRLSILRLIVQGPEAGTPAGEIQEHVGIPASTLSHHLACLAEGELVQVEREGTFLRYRADFATLQSLTEYLWEVLPMMERAVDLNLAGDKLLFFVQFRHLKKWDQFRLYLGKGEAEALARAVVEASGRLPTYIERERAAPDTLRSSEGLAFRPEEAPEALADD